MVKLPLTCLKYSLNIEFIFIPLKKLVFPAKLYEPSSDQPLIDRVHLINTSQEEPGVDEDCVVLIQQGADTGGVVSL